MTCIVLLAAGRSRRFGGIKLLADWNGVPLLRHAATTALAAGTEVLTVMGAYSAEAESALQGLEITNISNERWDEGLGTSIACAIRHLQDRDRVPSAALFALADQPLIRTTDFQGLLALNTQRPEKILAAGFSGQQGPPCLFPRLFFPELAQLSGEEGARSLLRRHADQVLTVPITAAAMDIDTPEDLERARQQAD